MPNRPPAMPQAAALDPWSRAEGTPVPLGPTWVEAAQAYNFALYSKEASAVTLLLYGEDDLAVPLRTIAFAFPQNKSNRVWHRLVPLNEIGRARYYAYKIDGRFAPNQGRRFDRHKVLLDPYARGIFLPPGFDREAARMPGPNDGKAPLAILPPRIAPAVLAPRARRHTHDLVIYEMHVRNFTRDPSSGIDPSLRGTYAGVAAKIPYLKELGVTAVELMPVHQYDPQEGSRWGYMTLGFFAPHHGYARGGDAGAAAGEFRAMVAALHAADIEVILDVVYNHTTEADHAGPTYSFRGIDNSTYYLLQQGDLSAYTNHSGCGNDMRAAHPTVTRLIAESLRYWAVEMGVDGFRFDLASIFLRDENGNLSATDPPLIAQIGASPELADLLLIAEPWEGDDQGYAFGRAFPGLNWRQWNDRFRGTLRRFVKGEGGLVGELMTRLHGSADAFPDDLAGAYRPRQSLNYVASHDGLCLYDLVAYTDDAQHGWDCGFPGEDGVPPEVAALRRRQVKNFCCLLLLANGTPMFCAGDEFLNTRKGAANPYRADDETVWLDWRRLDANRDVFRFFKEMIAFRKAHPGLGRSQFWDGDVRWHGVGAAVDLSANSHSLAFYLDGAAVADDDIYVMINGYWQDLGFVVQEGRAGEWSQVVATAADSPHDILDPGRERLLPSLACPVRARSVSVLVRKRAR